MPASRKGSGAGKKKTTSRKSTPQKQENVDAQSGVEDIEFEVVPTEEIQVERRPHRSRYLPLVEKVKGLEPGQSLIVPDVFLGEGDLDVKRNRVQSGVRRLLSDHPYRLRFRVTKNARVAISCESR